MRRAPAFLHASAVLAVIGMSIALLMGVFGGVGEPVKACEWVRNVPRTESFEVYQSGARVVREAHFVDVLVCRDGRTLVRRH